MSANSDARVMANDGCRFIVINFIEQHFPTTATVDVPPTPPPGVVVTQRLQDGSSLMSDGSYYGADGVYYPIAPGAAAGGAPPPPPPPRPSVTKTLQALVDLKLGLLTEAAALVLPPAPLDDLIDRLEGPDKVCEMTGRKGRLVRVKPDAARVKYELRATAEEEREGLNVLECKRFQRGECLVAIISDAASTGISLHASTSAVNQRRRVHVSSRCPCIYVFIQSKPGQSGCTNLRGAPYCLFYSSSSSSTTAAASS